MLTLLLRNSVPLMLLALTFLVWGERCVPGRDHLVDTWGEDGFLRLVVGLLCLFTYVQWLERQRLAESFTRVLKIFKEFQEARLRGAGGDGLRDNEQKLEAVRILVASLDSASDASVRAQSLAHLRRLTGQDFGDDVQAWRDWLAIQSGDPPAGGNRGAS